MVRAARLVRPGRIFDLAHVLDTAVPAFSGRAFRQRLGAPEGGTGRNRIGWVVETVMAPSQIGTHVDGLNLLRIGDPSYNGFGFDDIAEEWGTNRLGIETLPQIVTRGLLLDVAAVRAATGAWVAPPAIV